MCTLFSGDWLKMVDDNVETLDAKIASLVEQNSALGNRIKELETFKTKVEEQEKIIKDLREANMKLIKSFPTEPTTTNNTPSLDKMTDRDKYTYLKDLAVSSITAVKK